MTPDFPSPLRKTEGADDQVESADVSDSCGPVERVTGIGFPRRLRTCENGAARAEMKSNAASRFHAPPPPRQTWSTAAPVCVEIDAFELAVRVKREDLLSGDQNGDSVPPVMGPARRNCSSLRIHTRDCRRRPLRMLVSGR